jgi:hypothetical protein
MCRSIKRLRDGAQPAGEADVQEAARQFVRKVSGFGRPAAHNQAAFDAAVAEVAAATTRLLGALDVRGAHRPAPSRQGKSRYLNAG